VDIEIRQATPADYREIARVDGIAFGFTYSEQDFTDIFAVDPPEFVVALDGGRIVGNAGHYSFQMTVPGGAAVAVPGVTWVSVLPTHRRRGVLRALMEHLLAGYHALGYPAAVLTASEGGIYRRFGFGPSTQSVKISIDRTRVSMNQPADTSEVQFLPAEAARAPIAELHLRWRALTPGALSRSGSWWDHLLADREPHRAGMSEKFYLVHPDGYLAYRAAEQWNDGHAASRCVILDYFCVTPQAHAALWQVLLGMDLFTAIESWEVPVDDPLPFLLDDPRQVRIVAGKEGMWLRPVDVCALLAARNYPVDIEAVLDVDGDRVLLAGGPAGATCSPTERPADVRIGRAALGSAYLGAHRMNTLQRAGLLHVEDPARRAGLAARLDIAFSADRSAGYGTAF
jgi:predicted acetyltransferase